jgi:hypothetical protein
MEAAPHKRPFRDPPGGIIAPAPSAEGLENHASIEPQYFDSVLVDF